MSPIERWMESTVRMSAVRLTRSCEACQRDFPTLWSFEATEAAGYGSRRHADVAAEMAHEEAQNDVRERLREVEARKQTNRRCPWCGALSDAVLWANYPAKGGCAPAGFGAGLLALALGLLGLVLWLRDNATTWRAYALALAPAIPASCCLVLSFHLERKLRRQSASRNTVEVRMQYLFGSAAEHDRLRRLLATLATENVAEFR